MEYITIHRFLRMSPKKVRPVALELKKLKPMVALDVLPFIPKKGALPLYKVVKSALANAQLQGAKQEDLTFKEIQINEGPRLKRGRVGSRSRFKPIKKRMSHIRIVLESKTERKNGTKD